MKLKEFFQAVESKRTDPLYKGIGPVLVEMPSSDFDDLRRDCALLGWAPVSPRMVASVGEEYPFGPARVLIVKDAPERDFGSCTTYESSQSSPRELGDAVARVAANLAGTLDSIDIRPRKSGVWEVTAYTPSGRFIADALASGAASSRDEAEALYLAGTSSRDVPAIEGDDGPRQWVIGSHEGVTAGEYPLRPDAGQSLADAIKSLTETIEKGHKAKDVVVNMTGETVGTIDEWTAAKIAEQIETNRYENVSAGYDNPEPEPSIWTEIRDRIEDAVERDSPHDAMQWLEVAERLGQSHARLGFHD